MPKESHAFLVGRQPIFDAGLKVFGYELLFRGDRAAGGVGMTADVMVRSVLDLGIDALTGDKLAFVNAPRALLVGEYDIPLPSEQTVIEVLEDVIPDPDVFAGCRRLKDRGYRVALDDYTADAVTAPLLDLADLVKLDLLAIAPCDLAALVKETRRSGVTLLAEKVETRQQLAACREMGFELFQGYALQRPELVSGRAVSPNHLTCLRLLQLLCAPDISAKELQQVVESDAGLSQRLLRAAGQGADRGMRRRVGSIREAVVLLGVRRMRSWVSLMLLAGTQPESSEHLDIAMVRARMCELMASATRYPRPDAGFTVGLVSALEMLMAAPLPAVVETLSLTDELVEALLERKGPLGLILADVLAWERGEEGLELAAGLPPSEVEAVYLDALNWVKGISEVLTPAA